LEKIKNIYCIVKIAANICGFIRAFFDIESGTRPVINKLCIQIMDCITQQDFTRWHSANKECLPHLPYLFLNMIQHVFAQQAKFLANTLNTNKVEHGNNGSTLNVKQPKQTVKYISRFLKKKSDHVAEDSTPDSVLRFTPCHALLSNQVCTVSDAVAAVAVNAGDTKKKQDSSPPGTPARERRAKKARGGNKPMGGGPDQAKLGLFHAKKESNLKNSSWVILNQPHVLSSAPRIRNATGLVPLAPDPALSNGRTSSLATRRKF
jgi:hypothetical protein